MNLTLILAVVLAISAAFTLVVSVLQAWNIYRHPNFKPHPVINREEVHSLGFKWLQMELGSGIIPPMRTPEGAVWSGFSLGVSRENGKVATIGITVYGAEQGVGHYTWRARTNKFSSEVGAGGHFNMDRLIGEELSRREIRILGYAVDAASSGVNGYYRPLEFSVDKEKKTTTIYDPESGRHVFANHRDESLADFFIFGPPPMADSSVPYSQQPGAYINQSSLPEQEGLKQLIFKVWDVYERPLDHVLITVEDPDSGYRYQQNLIAEQTNTGGITLSVPSLLPRVQVAITRGGYYPVTRDIELQKEIPHIEVFMEPRCVLLGETLQCPNEIEH